MNISFLPAKIKKTLAGALADEIPLSVVRSSSTMDGDAGESYLVSFKDKMFIFSRRLGESDYSAKAKLFGEIAELSLRKEGMNVFLNVNLNGEKHSLKFSSFEEKNLKPVVDVWRNSGGGAAGGEIVEVGDDEPSPQSKESDAEEQPAPLSPLEGLAAAMMYVSAVDNHISENEDHYITSLFSQHRSLLHSALAYYKRHSFEDLIAVMKPVLTNDQKLCYLANIMELAMKDMVLHTSEQNMINHFIEEMGISHEESDAVRQVLLIKNKISALDA
jgi:uncharacterized tellurite resistance protein B-like protein